MTSVKSARYVFHMPLSEFIKLFLSHHYCSLKAVLRMWASNVSSLLIICFGILYFSPFADAKNENYAFHKKTNVTRKQILQKWERVAEKSKFSWKCSACKLAVLSLRQLFDTKQSKSCIAAAFTYFCLALKIEDQFVCKGIASEYKEEFIYVLNRLIFQPEEICSLFLPSCGAPKDRSWTINIPGDKPPVEDWIPPQTGSKTLRVLQLSDIHFDKSYTPGAESACNEPLCCRPNDPKNGTEPAGLWGTVSKCDVPERTIHNMLEYISKNIQFDYLIWSGDLPPHNIWNQSRVDQVALLKVLNGWFKKYFPDKFIFPVMGNHESAPADRRGSYSVSPYPGFRIISLNTQYADAMNFWLYLNQSDPDGTMSWLVEELHKAEQRKEKVHVIGHMPPGDFQTLSQWAANYYKVVNRFESTIRAQFFAHTHFDSFGVFYEDGDPAKRPTNLLFTGPSVTTFPHVIPSFKLYTIDGDYNNSTWAVLNHETYLFNLAQANVDNITVWHSSYTAKEEYGIQSLSPASLSHLINDFIQNETLFNNYLRHYNRDDNPNPQCNSMCKFNRLCELRSAKSYDHMHLCMDLPQNFNAEAQKGLDGSAQGRILLENIFDDVYRLKNTIGSVFNICRPSK